MLKRVTFRGAGLFANGKQLNRISAFGATGTLSKEEVFELANPDIVEIVEDSPEVSMTIDANEFGSLETIALLAGKDPETVSTIKFSEDFEHATVPIWNYIKANIDDDTVFTQLMTGCVLTGYSANFSTDGNSTENFSLVSDNKIWLLGNEVHAIQVKLSGSNKEYTADVNGFNAETIRSVSVNGRILSSTEYLGEVGIEGISVTLAESAEDDAIVYAVVSGKAIAGSYNDQLKFIVVEPDLDNFKRTIKRRGHIEVYLTHEDEKFRVTPAQSVSIDANLSREDIPALGYKRFYDRPLTLPIDVTASIDVIFNGLDIFAKLAGKDGNASSLSLDEFRNDLGLEVHVNDRTDVDAGEREVVKVLKIPRIIPSDEAWNISLDGQATQTFSFRGMELEISKG